MEISLLRGERGCEILVDNFCLEFLKFFASHSLCSSCMSLIYFIHLLYSYIYTLCSVFARNIFSLIYLIHRNFAFFQNKKTKIYFEILNCKRGHMPIFVLKFKRNVLEKVEFLRFTF